MTNASECRHTFPDIATQTVSPRFYLVSVGISLVSNFNKQCPGSAINLQDIQYIDHKPPFTNHKAALEDNRNFRKYNDHWATITKKIETLSDRDEIAAISAEMSSLLGEKATFRQDDEVLLVATNTPEGHLCSHALKEILHLACDRAGVGCPQVEIKCDLDGLGAAKAKGFSSRGLPNFISFVQSRISSVRLGFCILFMHKKTVKR